MSEQNSSRRRLLRRAAGSALVLTLAPDGLRAALAEPSGADYLHEAKPEREARMEWWRDARFGMFIHWGVYSVPAGRFAGKDVPGIGEWIMASGPIPPADYQKFPPQFNPVKFNAAEWVGIARNAGMKYIVITSKHHDGFAMFDSRVSDYDIVDATPYHHDVLKDLSRECRRQGLKFCTYYSILDWHHPAQMPRPGAPNQHDALANDAMRTGRKDEYLDFMRGQLREILTQYDPAVLWFDGEWVNWWTEQDGKDLYNWLRSIKPSLIINNRIGKGRKGMEGLSKGQDYAGDFGTPEQQIPPTGLPGVDWESCMTMNDTWGFKSEDHNWKSATTLIRNLVDIASKGGNFLLNVGPTSQGQIPEPSQERLHAVGDWMKVNHESIYRTNASPFPQQLAWGRATSRRGKIYLHVFDWPSSGKLRLPEAPSAVKRVYLLSDRKKAALPFGATESMMEITLPAQAPDSAASVIVLDVRS
jgi:alpha-L-fucosidase